MSADLPAPPDVSGRSLDGNAPYVIKADENAALCRSLGAEPANDGTAHPIYYFIATQLGMRVTVAGLCEICGFNVADGPMIIGSAVRFDAPLYVDRPYRVTGSILNIERKRSRKLGVMDVLEYRLALVDGDRDVLVTTNTWVLPRRELS